MDKKQILVLAIIILLIIFTHNSYAEDKVIGIVKMLYPDYNVVTLDDFDNLDKDFLLKMRINKNPGVVVADFDGNGLDDFALILSKKAKDNNIFCFILQTKKDTYKPYEIINFKRVVNYICIFKVKPNILVSPTDAFDTGQNAIALKHPGVELIYIGKSSIVYYWDKETNTFKSITTGD